MSAAIKQLERQLDVQLLTRHGRRVSITPAGELLLRRGRELLEHADGLAAEVRQRHGAATGRLRMGLSPTARYGIAPKLLAACAAQAPGVMLYTSEDTTGALLRDVAQGALDLAITFCAPQPTAAGIELTLLGEEPAIVHLPAEHPLADRSHLGLADLADQTILIAASLDSSGFTDRVLSAFGQQGIAPRTRTDPYPDLGLQAVREHLGVVIYARGAFPHHLDRSAFIPLQPPLGLPFHIATRQGVTSAPVRSVLTIADALNLETAA